MPEIVKQYLNKTGRKLAGFVVAVVALSIVAFGAYGLVGVGDFDTSFATNIVITVSSAVCTLYAAFVGGNYGEHVAKSKNQNGAEAPPEVK